MQALPGRRRRATHAPETDGIADAVVGSGKKRGVPDRDDDVSGPATLVPINRGGATSDERLVTLWNAHYGSVLAYAKRRAPAEMATEVASAVFTVLWRRIDDPLDDPLPWLLAVARRELANQRRGEARRRHLSLRVRRSTRADASIVPDLAVGAVEGTLARAALARLRPEDREVLMLVAWEGLDPARAAAVLGVTPATFAVRLHRARRRLESHLSLRSEEQTS
jgi:RNA polymerase sigma factor (sigma-70 family)